MKKIYTYASNLIKGILMELYSNHEFTTTEISWKVLDVCQEHVTFKISERIKDLMKEELSKSKFKEGNITFEKEHDHWVAIVHANGVESYFFSRILFSVLSRIKCGTFNTNAMNKALIEYYTRATFPKTQGTQLGLILDIGKKDRTFFMTIPIEGVDWTFSDENIDVLCKNIGVKLRGKITCSKPKEEDK